MVRISLGYSKNATTLVDEETFMVLKEIKKRFYPDLSLREVYRKALDDFIKNHNYKK